MQSLQREISGQESLGHESLGKGSLHVQMLHAQSFHPQLLHRQSLRLPIDGAAYRIAKRSMDLLLAIVLLPVAICLALVVALVVKLDSPGPVLYRHTRVGRRGRPFELLKFRTMFHESDHILRDHLAKDADAWKEWCCYRKLKKDPRITRMGAFLRRSNLDEIPQLLNVLRGEMSLVGPRPLPVDEVRRFSDLAHRRRLSVKPGLTCLWQIAGRNQIFDFKDWVRLDLEYIDNWSLWLDFKILLLTIPAVFRGTGAK
jgi:lipopolysaccharide/colanic/teichoic acid biosynthesis glycosyltransferase